MRENEKENTQHLESKIEQVIRSLMREGYQVDARAFTVLREQVMEREHSEIIKLVLEKIQGLQNPILIITDEIIKEAIAPLPEEKIETSKTVLKHYAEEIETDLKVVEDPSTRLQSAGDVEYFLEYFRDRFNRMSRILRQRLDSRDAISISNVLESPRNLVVRTIGIVIEKRETTSFLL